MDVDHVLKYLITAEDVPIEDMLEEYSDFDAKSRSDELNALFLKAFSEAASPSSPSAPHSEQSILETDLWDMTDDSRHSLCDICKKISLDASEVQIFAFGKCHCVG